ERLQGVNDQDAIRRIVVVERRYQGRNGAPITDLPERPRHDRLSLWVVEQRYKGRDSPRIPQIAKKMRRVVAAGGLLPLEAISAVAGHCRAFWTRGSLRPGGENIDDRR